MRTQKIYRILEISLWVIAAVLLPVISIIPWIFRIRNLKKKNPGQNRLYMWAVFVFMMIVNILYAGILFLAIIAGAIVGSPSPSISRENVSISEYGTAEKLYELTGIMFPDIAPVDSLQYNMWGVDPIEWTEHKYVFSDSPDESFYKSLENACTQEPEHWKIMDYIKPYYYMGIKIGTEDKVYHYEKSTPPETGKSYFISVDVQNDTIWLRKGYICY